MFVDLPTGSYIQEDLSRCSSLCEAGSDCCDLMASCKCGTHTGQYDCICEKGYYGKGLQHECTGRLDGWLCFSCVTSLCLILNILSSPSLLHMSAFNQTSTAWLQVAANGLKLQKQPVHLTQPWLSTWKIAICKCALRVCVCVCVQDPDLRHR